MVEIPYGSIYLWMYTQGLKHVELSEIECACRSAGIDIRQKDYENYWNGYYRSDLYVTEKWKTLFTFKDNDSPASLSFESVAWDEYPVHPYIGLPEIENRYVPCNKNNRPMIKWSTGCLSQVDASCFTNQVYLAENLVGTKKIVIDCDGDHEKELDMETINFLWSLAQETHSMYKPKAINKYAGYENTGDLRPASFHLTYLVDRIIPTMHLPWCHIDIIGNKKNSLRYFKNKVWNNHSIQPMTGDIWSRLQEYSKSRH